MQLKAIASWLGARSGVSDVGPIGLDLCPDRVHAVQLERAGGALRLCAAASGVSRGGLDHRRELSRALAGPLRQLPFQGRRVVAALPDEQVKLMLLHYEPSAAESEAHQILGLVQERIGDDLERCVIDYVELRQDPDQKKERSALVAVAREEEVTAYLELLRGAGLEAEALEVAPVSLRRLLMRLAEDPGHGNALTIHFGVRRSYLTVLWGRRLILYREIDFGEAKAVAQLGRSLELPPGAAGALLAEYGVGGAAPSDPPSDAGASASEIRRTLQEILTPALSPVAEQVSHALVYTASRTRGESIDLVWVLGPVARWPGIEVLLERLLGRPVRTLDPLGAVGGGRSERILHEGPPCDLALATGLALRGLAAGASEPANE